MNLDQSVVTRAGEQLETAHIDRYFKQHFPDISGSCEISQFPGGASNLTYLIQYSEQEFVLRRPPFGTIAKSAHDMIREAKVIQQLSPYYSGTPKVLAICEDESVMGCPFYVMERISGFIPRQDLPTDIAADPTLVRKICLSGINKLIELHQIPISDTPLEQLGKGSGYVARQIKGWSERFTKAKTDDVNDFAEVIKWLNDNQPNDVKTCVIHNDFRFDNLIYDPEQKDKVIGVLDWEMATLGDPLMDLGNSLAYWVQADDDQVSQMMRRQPTHVEGMLTRQEVIDYYLERSGFQIKSFNYYLIYGLFRLAVIIQQIYFRFYHKQTSDKRFAGFGQFANYLEQRCLGIIKQS